MISDFSRGPYVADEQTPIAPGNGSDNGTGPQSTDIEIQIIAQFVRDLSFESPNIESLISGPGENPI